jgi:hypothetical protein
MYVKPLATSTNWTERQPSFGMDGDRGVTHQLSAVHIFVLLDELIDVPMFHPFGDHREPTFAYRHSKQRKDIRMPEVFPGDSLSAESLQPVYPRRSDNGGRRLTLRMTSKSSMRHTRTTLMATRRPLYIPCDTLAKPPRSTSTAPFEQSGMCMDFGITRCRLHVLQSLLSNFSRS